MRAADEISGRIGAQHVLVAIEQMHCESPGGVAMLPATTRMTTLRCAAASAQRAPLPDVIAMQSPVA
jgi:hypothetical protein